MFVMFLNHLGAKMKITEIRKQKGKKDLFSIFVDGNFVCSLDEYTIYKHKLLEGCEIDKTSLEEMQSECMIDFAFSQSVDLLAKMMKTEKQIREYLYKKGYLKKVVDAVVEKLKSYKYINDVYFAECYVKQKQNSVGKFKLKNELKLKGVDEQIINNILDELESQGDVAFSIATKYLKNKEKSPQNLQKLSRHLATKGFSWDEINNVLNKIKKEGNVYEDWE